MIKIKDIKSKEVQEEAVRLAREYNGKRTPLSHILDMDIQDAFNWDDTPQLAFWAYLRSSNSLNHEDLKLPDHPEHLPWEQYTSCEKMWRGKYDFVASIEDGEFSELRFAVGDEDFTIEDWALIKDLHKVTSDLIKIIEDD